MVGPDEDAHGGESVRLPDVAVLGVDGWRGAWVGALLDGRVGHAARAARRRRRPRRAGRRGDRASTCRSGSRTTASRACDVAARRLLRPAPAARSSPRRVRGVLATADYAEALRGVPAAPSGKALSVQAWNLVPAIRALDDALGDAADRPRASRCIPSWRSAPSTAGSATGRRSARGTGRSGSARSSAVDGRADALAEAAAGRPGGRRAGRLRRRLVGRSASPTGRRECVGDGTPRRPRPPDADLLVGEGPVRADRSQARGRAAGPGSGEAADHRQRQHAQQPRPPGATATRARSPAPARAR